MYRIDDPSASPTLPAPEAALTEGYWTEGNPATGTPATLERASWFNMVQEELRAIPVAAGIVPSKVVYNQILTALMSMFSSVVGTAVNLKCILGTVGTSLTYTADQVCAATSLGGTPFMLSNFSQTLNGATTGIGGLDTGTLAANSFYAIYAAYNPTTGTQGIFAQLEPSGGATTVYGGTHAPSGYTATALIGVWPTNGSSQFIVGSQYARKFNFVATFAYTGSGAVSLATVSIASIVPKCAKYVSGSISITVSTSGISSIFVYDQNISGASQVGITTNTGNSTSGGVANNFSLLPVLTAQTLYVSSSQGATISSMGFSLTQFQF